MTGFVQFVSSRPWVAVNDMFAIRCFSCGDLAAGGRGGFCRLCTDSAHQREPEEELGGEA
ncbi:MAG TPA: hypothetical protein VL326_10570 [Kofleriaceae bacterium]|nr:hypothetical protein [Kofleriaceae bacterium]